MEMNSETTELQLLEMLGLSLEDVSGDDVNSIPPVIIATNVPDAVFSSENAKEEFELLFRHFGADEEIAYLKNFRRARIQFSSGLKALKAKVYLHEKIIFGQKINCYFGQNNDPAAESSPTLKPPVPYKQFLISPPASPPEGWEPIEEGVPVVNYDLLAAIANLAPGSAHELHPSSGEKPAIVVHICENPVGYGTNPAIEQTRCPERQQE